MSKEFLLAPGATKEYGANKYEEVTKHDKKFIYFSKDGKPHKFGYCTCCELKVFLTAPKKENGDYFFRHVSGYYTATEQIRMLSCDNYKPSKGVAGSPPKLIESDFLEEIYSFIKENSFWIYKYINKILPDKIYMKHSYFIRQINDIFVTNAKELTTANKISERTLPYNILALMNDLAGNIYYPEIGFNSINLNKLVDDNKIKYYNYIHFSMRDEFTDENLMGIEVIKSFDHMKKMDIIPPEVLYTTSVELDKMGLFKYIEKQKEFEFKYTLSDEQINNSKFKFKESIIKEKPIYHEIKNSINNLLSAVK